MRLHPCLVIALFLSGCGHRPVQDGFFSGSRIINTADPAFQRYYQDNDRNYVRPRNYMPSAASGQPPKNPYEGTIPTLNPYYANPTDNDSNYVPLKPQPADPTQSPAMQQYYEHPTDNDSSYVPPHPSGNQKPAWVPKPAEKQHYPDHDEEYYPMIYDN